MSVEVREIVNFVVVVVSRTDSMMVLKVLVCLRQKEYGPRGIPYTALGVIKCPENGTLIADKICAVEQYVKELLSRAGSSKNGQVLSWFSLFYSEIEAATLNQAGLSRANVAVGSSEDELDIRPDLEEIPAHLLVCNRCRKPVIPETWNIILSNGKTLCHLSGTKMGQPIRRGNFQVVEGGELRIEPWCRRCLDDGPEKRKSFPFGVARWRLENKLPPRQSR